MIKVVEFGYYNMNNNNYLSKKINLWLIENKGVKIIDLKYSTAGGDCSVVSSALILYDDNN